MLSDPDDIVLFTVDPIAAGDMNRSTFDPNSINADAFDMDNMVEGADTKIPTADKMAKLAGIEPSAYVNPTASEIVAAITSEVPALDQSMMEAGTAPEIGQWSAKLGKKAIVALAPNPTTALDFSANGYVVFCG